MLLRPQRHAVQCHVVFCLLSTEFATNGWVLLLAVTSCNEFPIRPGETRTDTRKLELLRPVRSNPRTNHIIYMYTVYTCTTFGLLGVRQSDHTCPTPCHGKQVGAVRTSGSGSRPRLRVTEVLDASNRDYELLIIIIGI